MNLKMEIIAIILASRLETNDKVPQVIDRIGSHRNETYFFAKFVSVKLNFSIPFFIFRSKNAHF